MQVNARRGNKHENVSFMWMGQRAVLWVSICHHLSAHDSMKNMKISISAAIVIYYLYFAWFAMRDRSQKQNKNRKNKLTDIRRISCHLSVASITTMANKFCADARIAQHFRQWISCCIRVMPSAVHLAFIPNSRCTHERDVESTGAPAHVVPSPHRCRGEYALLRAVPDSGENAMQQFPTNRIMCIRATTICLHIYLLLLLNIKF